MRLEARARHALPPFLSSWLPALVRCDHDMTEFVHSVYLTCVFPTTSRQAGVIVMLAQYSRSFYVT